MSVTATLRIQPEDFALGQLIDSANGHQVELETMVPLGGRTLPFLWVENGDHEEFIDDLRAHPMVATIERTDTRDERTLYTVDWTSDPDHVFDTLAELNAQILEARTTPSGWEFELRFLTHEALSAFQDHCRQTNTTLDIVRISQSGSDGDETGLTDSQRSTIALALLRGYYNVPRGCTAIELGDELGISDTAITQRLRRGEKTLLQRALSIDTPLPEME